MVFVVKDFACLAFEVNVDFGIIALALPVPRQLGKFRVGSIRIVAPSECETEQIE